MIVKKIVVAVLKGYKLLISPFLPPACGYMPTCSEYAMEAVDKYGSVKGGFLAFKRILRCNPFHRGGYDPVP